MVMVKKENLSLDISSVKHYVGYIYKAIDLISMLFIDGTTSGCEVHNFKLITNNQN